MIKHFSEFKNLEKFNIVKGKGKNKSQFADILMSFDIETTTIDRGEKPTGFMYIWQFAINETCYYGRRWEEFQKFISIIKKELNGCIGVVYVHNLSFEFQFMRNFITIDSMFAKDKRKVLKCTSDNIEFRCSYFLSNMSLSKFCENSKYCEKGKLSGVEYDYKKIRTPDTPLTEKELEYCAVDVLALNQCIKSKLEENSDSLATIPLTSTGIVRRECRQFMKRNAKNRYWFKNSRLTADDYIQLKDAIRGGNTASNRLHVDKILSNVRSRDAVSSYPFQMVTKKYPTGRFDKITIGSEDELNFFLEKYACLFYVAFEGLRLKSEEAVPYIPVAKLKAKKNLLPYNGRVITADIAVLALTEIDYKIIESQYTWDTMSISKFKIARKEYLPQELRDFILYYFRKKTELKGKDSYLYAKMKNMLNGIFGMCMTDFVHDIYSINEDYEWVKESGDIEGTLNNFYNSRNSFLPFQIGAWVTAYAREHLQKLLDITGIDTVYTDTDSDKYLGDNHEEDIEVLNNSIKEECEERGAFIDYNGKRWYLGYFEKEETSEIFKTLGAKKYAGVKNGKLYITVAGVNKVNGAKQLEEMGGLSRFEIGTIFSKTKDGLNAGGTCSWFNDEKEMYSMTIDGSTFLTGSNIAIKESTYTLGVTKDFFENLEKAIDIFSY